MSSKNLSNWFYGDSLISIALPTIPLKNEHTSHQNELAYFYKRKNDKSAITDRSPVSTEANIENLRNRLERKNYY